MKTWRDRGLILVAALLHGLVYVLLLPAWMGEDEPWHVEYAHHLSTGHMPWGGVEMRGAEREEEDDRRLMPLSQLQVRQRIGGLQPSEIADTQKAILDSMKEEDFFRRVDFAPWSGGASNFDQVQDAFTATHQPPLYHVLAALVMKATGASTPLEELRSMRWIGFVCYLAMIAITLALARLVTKDLALVALAGFICAWIPMHARQAAVVNNDVLAKVVGGTLLLAGAYQLTRAAGKVSAASFLTFMVLVVLAFATKTTTLVCVFCAGIAYIAVPTRSDAGKTLAAALACGGLLAIGYGYWRATHSPSIPTNWEDVRERLALGLSSANMSELWRTSVGAFNWYSRDLPGGVSSIVMFVVSCLMLGALWRLGRPKQINRVMLAMCLCALLFQWAMIILRGVSAGRYLFPVLPALATLLAVGAMSLGPNFTRRRVVSGVVIGLIAFDAVFLWRGLLVEQYLVWGT